MYLPFRMSFKPIEQWFHRQGWKVHAFQREAWEVMCNGESGMINAPTGSGKTYSALLGVLADFMQQHPDYKTKKKNRLQIIWITPIRALARELGSACERALSALEIPWKVNVRTGDSTTKEKNALKKDNPEVLITTPESLHILLTQKGYPEYFKTLQYVIVDEWHELIGSKRGVQVELALSRLKGMNAGLQVWGISATIGNLGEAMEVLHGKEAPRARMIRADIKKKIEIETIFPDVIEHYPWAGHLGVRLLKKIIPIIEGHRSTLIFTNTRAQAEIWYRQLMEDAPELAGAVALHHGSLDQKTRNWVEEALHEEKLKAVICTSSLDLGVDFRPVEAVIQVGSPKGVARFMQRAGRSGHQPGAISKLYFLPTNSLEIIEGAAMRQALKDGITEQRIPYVRSFDVLIQYLLTLAVSDGFDPAIILKEIRDTFSYSSITDAEWSWVLMFITTGSLTLRAYEEYQKAIYENGLIKIVDKRIALRHKFSIGTIVSSTMMQVKYLTGKRLGSIEEWFISRLKPGDLFWFSGHNLEFVKVHDMDALVRKSKSGKGIVPSWQGGRMPLSSLLAAQIRMKVQEYLDGKIKDEELKKLGPLFKKQQEKSFLPGDHEFLIEYLESDEGHHLFFYPYEGRFVHEGMAVTMAHQLGKFRKATFSIAMNDYGFELLSDQPIAIEDALKNGLLDFSKVMDQLRKSVNATEMAERKFRDIASISGLLFQGYPGKTIKTRHLQANSHLFFKVFQQYEPENLLLQQAYEEVMIFQLELNRLKTAYERIQKQKVIIRHLTKPSPFAFPIMIDRMREKYSNETLEEQVRKLKAKIS